MSCHTHFYNLSALSCYLCIAVLNTVKSKLMACAMLACAYWVGFDIADEY